MINDIREKINAIVEKIDDKHLYYILAGILLFVFLLDYVILMRPQLGALSKINPEITILGQDIKQAKDDIARRDSFTLQVAQLTEQVEQANRKIKLRAEVPLILESISRVADENGIVIDEIRPDSLLQEEVLKIKDRTYWTIPVDIQARGAYHDFGRFLNGLEYGDIFLNIDHFSFIASNAGQKHTLNLRLLAVVYEE